MKILEVKGLTKNYKEVQAVRGIDFTINKGEFVALLGPNGAGKSTTINILCTLLQQTDGEIAYQNAKIGKDDELIREKIGVVFQESVLDDKLTVFENLETRGILYFKDKTLLKEKLDYIIDTLELEDILKQYYTELSGGQRRRVDIARALLHSPEILFLDEPTTGLDPSTRKLVWETMKVLRDQGLTIVLTTHYMEETINCDRIIVMDHGKIIAQDTPEQLRVKHSHDTLKVLGNKKEIKKHLKNYDHQEKQDFIEVKLNETTDSLELLNKIKNHLVAFEVIRGSMDDVFVNLTGRRLQ